MTCRGLVDFALPDAYSFPSISCFRNVWFHRLRSIHIMHTLYCVICDFNTKTQYVINQNQMVHFPEGKSIMCVEHWSFAKSHNRGLLLMLLQMTNVSQLSYHTNGSWGE